MSATLLAAPCRTENNEPGSENQALEQTRDSVLRYGEVVGCELLNFFVRQQEAQSQSMEASSRIGVTVRTIGRCIVKPRAIVAVGVVLAVSWGLTLGWGQARYVRFATKEFTVEPTTLIVAWWIVPKHTQMSGIPFLLFSTADCPPFTLDFAFWSSSVAAGDSLVIQRAEVRYKDGSTQPLSIPSNGLRLKLKGRWSRSISIWESAVVKFPDALMKQEDFTLLLSGTIESGHVHQDFSLSHEVTLIEEAEIVTGWSALLSEGDRYSRFVE